MVKSLILLAAAGFVLSSPLPNAAVIGGPSRVWSYDDVYAVAVLRGRDPDAAVRKARYRTNILVRDLGFTSTRAAAEVSEWMVRNAGSICAGG